MDINYDKLAVNDEGCIREIKRNLELTCNHQAGKLIGRVLHTIRESLTYAESAQLIQMLPDNIKIIYVSDWKLHSKKLNLESLDTLINEVIKNDQQHADKVLHNELYAFHAIVVTLKALDKHIGILSFDFFNYSLKQELAEAMSEAA